MKKYVWLFLFFFLFTTSAFAATSDTIQFVKVSDLEVSDHSYQEALFPNGLSAKILRFRWQAVGYDYGKKYL